MKVLVVGSGGREHAICTALKRSKRLTKLYCAPGNAGIAALAECVDIKVMEFEKLVSFAKEKNMSFAEHVIMDTLGLSRESAGEYISSLAEKHGYDKNDVAKIVYEILLAGEKN